jgi:hypothetical protein
MPLFTEVRGREILRSSHRASGSGIMILGGKDSPAEQAAKGGIDVY